MSKILDYRCAGNSIKLIGADTNLLIILLYFWNSEIAEITMLSESIKKNEGIVGNISRITESAFYCKCCYISCISGILSNSRVEHIDGKDFGSN